MTITVIYGLEIARNLRKAELYLVLSFFILPLVELDPVV